MNRRGVQTVLVMMVLFGVVFCPILLFAWTDLQEILMLGVKYSSELADYVWNGAGVEQTPTDAPATDGEIVSLATKDYIPITGPTTTRMASFMSTGTHPYFMSATSDDHSRPTHTPTLKPTRTPTPRPSRTATLIGTRTPTKIPTITPRITITLRPTVTVPTPTPRPTRTPTPRPTRTPTPRPTATEPPPPTTEIPPTQPPPTDPPPTDPPPTDPPPTNPPPTSYP